VKCVRTRIVWNILYMLISSFLLDLTCILHDSNDQCRLNGAATFSTYLSLSNICKLNAKLVWEFHFYYGLLDSQVYSWRRRHSTRACAWCQNRCDRTGIRILQRKNLSLAPWRVRWVRWRHLDSKNARLPQPEDRRRKGHPI